LTYPGGRRRRVSPSAFGTPSGPPRHLAGRQFARRARPSRRV